MQASATSSALGAGLSSGASKAIAIWLGGCSAWVFSMVVLGGMTRLTRSGLSMTEWKFTGEKAPSSQVCTALALNDFVGSFRHTLYEFVLPVFNTHCKSCALLILMTDQKLEDDFQVLR